MFQTTVRSAKRPSVPSIRFPFAESSDYIRKKTWKTETRKLKSRELAVDQTRVDGEFAELAVCRL